MNELQIDNINKIFELEKTLKPFDTGELPLEHHFCGGVYARQMFIPAGTVLTGKMHKEDNLNVMLYGDITVATQDGVRRVDKPCVIVSKAGTKRAGYAHKDTCWITFHATQETDLETIEKKFIIDNPQEYIEEQKRSELCHGEQSLS